MSDNRPVARLGIGAVARQASCDRVRAVAAAHLEDIHRKIADLRRMERTLRDLVSRCAGTSVPDYPIIEALRP